MRFLILIPFMLAMLFSSAWEPPTECADEDREIAGNRSTPCKLILPELETVEYRVEHIDPYCVEKLVFHLPGIDEPTEEIDIQPEVSRLPNPTSILNTASLWQNRQVRIEVDSVTVFGEGYGSNYRVGEDSVLGKWSGRSDYIGLLFKVSSDVRSYSSSYNLLSNFVVRPDTTAKLDLINSCFDLVRQAQAARDHATAVKKAEAEAQAQATAQADAANKAEEQAKLEAEAQARIAILETKAAVEARKKVQEAELLKTQTLIKDIEHRQELGAILRDIVRIRLAGEQDRVRLTNDYLLNVSTTVATFDEEVKAIESKVQEYVEFNQSLIEQLEAYHAGLVTRLQAASNSVEQQQQRIEDLEGQIKQLETQLESPISTTTEQ